MTIVVEKNRSIMQSSLKALIERIVVMVGFGNSLNPEMSALAFTYSMKYYTI